MLENLPNDLDGMILRQLAAYGSDLSKPMDIGFAVDVPNEASGKEVAAKAFQLGFKPNICKNRNGDRWTCNCTKTMIPDHGEIVAIQEQLDAISQPLGGKSDGWGSFGNGDQGKS